MERAADRQADGAFGDSAAAPLISVVVPLFNEEACLETLYERLQPVLSDCAHDYEIVFVDDGSRDRSLDILRGLRRRDRQVRYLSFSRNFGHEAATSCGLAHVRGRTVVIIDADLQDPPECIPDMLAQWREGFDVVYAQRRGRLGETWFTKATSYAFYRLYARLAPTPIPVDTGDFRLMDRAVVEAFLAMPERQRFVRGMLGWTGFRQTAVRYDRDARFAGETKYRFGRRLALAVDAVCATTVKPLRLLWWLGGALVGGGVAGLLTAVCATVAGVAVAGHWWLTAALAVFSGVQTLGLALVGEYVGRTHVEAQARPLYIVAEDSAAVARTLETPLRAA